MKRFFLLFATCIAVAAHAQTYVPIVSLSGSANPLISTTVPVGWQYGTNTGTTTAGVDCSKLPGCWLQSTAAATLTNFPTLYSSFASDPAPGLNKIFQVAEQAASVLVTVNTNGALTTITVPAASTVYSPTYRAGTIYPMTLSKIAVIAGSPAATLLASFNIPAYLFVSGVLQNFTMAATWGNVPVVCTFGGVTTAGLISLNCSPAQK